MYYNYSPYFGYVKKEDAKEILRRRTVGGWVFAGSFVFIFSMMELFVLPRLASLAIEAGQVLPFYSQPNFRYSVYLVLILATILAKPESGEAIDSKLKQYKAGEMILVSKLVDRKYEYILMSILFAVMAYMVISIILPIYDITASI